MRIFHNKNAIDYSFMNIICHVERLVPYISTIHFPRIVVTVYADSHDFLEGLGEVQDGMGVVHRAIDCVFGNIRIVWLALLVEVVNVSILRGLNQVALSPFDLNHHGDPLAVVGREDALYVGKVLPGAALFARRLFQCGGYFGIDGFGLGVILLPRELFLAPVLNLFFYAFAVLGH